MNAREVTTCVRPMSWAACARLAGPVVQLSSTGSFPTRCKPRKAISQATDAGSIKPTFVPGRADSRRESVSVPTSKRS